MTSTENTRHGDDFFIAYADIAACHKAMEQGRLSALQLVDYMLQRIERWDRNGPCLRAMLTINPAARELARKKDRALADKGLTGPLHGIPVVVKDNANTRDMPTTAGSRSLEGLIPAQNSSAVQRLIDAGAIILGKSNLHEFAQGGMTVSSLGGQTLNPYDLSRTCGGSSGGSAVALAMDFCTVALGTDTVNSIRSPASAANLVGLRPTRGLISRAGWVPVAETQDVVGPMGRTVQDVALVLDALAGYDPADPVTAHSIGHMPVSYSGGLDHASLKGRRFGMPASLYGHEAVHQP
ncbi:MAG TPA: amidase, partial [Burkholderiaceae bacterium]|nr:amidase [Burkholderiaceae bacterium]